MQQYNAKGHVGQNRTRTTTKASQPDVSVITAAKDALYCPSVYKTIRRKTRTMEAGPVKIGSDHPIALQTMTTTDTRDVRGSVDQIKQCVDAGADLVRLTVQGRKEAEACADIKNTLLKEGYNVPLVADIHFQPAIAMLVADSFDKIRVNPGNFADGTKKFDELTFDKEGDFELGREIIAEKFLPLVEKCKKLNRAMRIGTNHGSLSARILSYYGDTPNGMVKSAFEFAELCREQDYHNFVFSMKASNPIVMVQAYRLLSEKMNEVGWDYPLHLGVTEAGEGEDGRMKSAIGIGSLLMDGIGDTIRVSLTEDPQYELVPCSTLASLGKNAIDKGYGVREFGETGRDIHEFTRRVGTLTPQQVSDGDVDYRGLLHRDGSVFSSVSLKDLANAEVLYRDLGCKMAVGMPFKDIATSDTLFMRELPPADDKIGRRSLKRLQEVGVHIITPIEQLKANAMGACVASVGLAQALEAGSLEGLGLPEGCHRAVLTLNGTESDEQLMQIKSIESFMSLILLNIAPTESRVHASRLVFQRLKDADVQLAVIHHADFKEGIDRDQLVLTAGTEVGCLLVDGLGDGVLLECPSESVEYLRTTSFGMLQGSRMRNTKTEYISCPSCGRTLFDLQEVTEQIRQKTGHLPGVSIAVMGCIVNGPGEMADADFGYVGGAVGKIDLYVGKEVVQRGINMDIACDALIQLIKDHGRWVDPEPEEEEEQEQELATTAA